MKLKICWKWRTRLIKRWQTDCHSPYFVGKILVSGLTLVNLSFFNKSFEKMQSSWVQYHMNSTSPPNYPIYFKTTQITKATARVNCKYFIWTFSSFLFSHGYKYLFVFGGWISGVGTNLQTSRGNVEWLYERSRFFWQFKDTSQSHIAILLMIFCDFTSDTFYLAFSPPRQLSPMKRKYTYLSTSKH